MIEQNTIIQSIDNNINKKRKHAIDQLQQIINELESNKKLEYVLSSRKLELINELIISKEHIEDLFY